MFWTFFSFFYYYSISSTPPISLYFIRTHSIKIFDKRSFSIKTPEINVDNLLFHSLYLLKQRSGITSKQWKLSWKWNTENHQKEHNREMKKKKGSLIEWMNKIMKTILVMEIFIYFFIIFLCFLIFPSSFYEDFHDDDVSQCLVAHQNENWEEKKIDEMIR